MKRRWKILTGMASVLAILLAINTYTTDRETREAAPTIEGAQIMELSRGAIQVTDSGEPKLVRAGQPIVLLHCYACSLRWFDRLEPLLTERHRVIRIDLLGFGGSEKPESGYEIPNQAAIVAEALNRLGVEGALVAGNSMGASVATSLAEQASQLVDRVAIIDMAPNTEDFGPGLPFLAKLAYTPVVGEALWRTTPDFVVRDVMADAFAPGFDPESGFDSADQVVDDYRAMTYSSFDQAPAAAEDFAAEMPLDDRLTRAAVPALVIFGSEDQLFDAEAAIAGYAGVPGVETELLDGIGHAPQVEDPGAIAKLLEDFAVVPPKPTAKPKQSSKQRPGARTKGRQAKKSNGNANKKQDAKRRNKPGNRGKQR